MQYKIAYALLLLATVNTATAVQILPTPHADRSFQFIRTSQTFMGTPLQTEALTPHALFIIDRPGDHLDAFTMHKFNHAFGQEDLVRGKYRW